MESRYKRRYNKDLQRQKQRQRRHQKKNRQIWERLQAIVATAKSTETTLVQLTQATEESQPHPLGEDLIAKAMAGQHWVAIGDYTEEQQAKASVGRRVVDGILFRVAVSLNGRRVVALIDSGASQSYVAPETVTLCELNCIPVVLHLELADGSKIQSNEQAQDVVCTLGETSGKMTFTVTKLLSNVDVVLGMDWLRRWNPVIDWKSQILHVYVNNQWTQVNGVHVDAAYNCGTVKVIDPYSLCVHGDKKHLPDWTVVKQPKLWEVKRTVVQKENVSKNEMPEKKLSMQNEQR